jgi:pimeloyl-ACP methyl ester carboxylesterase
VTGINVKTKCVGLVFCLLTGIPVVRAQTARAGSIVLEPYALRTYDGKEHAAELGKLWVRENPAGNSGRLIQLAFVRLRTTAAKPAAPIIFLAGGPGIPGIGLAQVPVYFSLFERLRAVSDVILLDQRGTGLSSPNLQCPAATFSSDTFETTGKFLAAYSEFVRTCTGHFRAEGVDLTAYNSNASADDLESLRVGLEAERLNLLAWSYGTELALAMVRRHGDRLNQVVLAGTRGPDNLLNLPSVWDEQIRKISRLAAADGKVGPLVPDMEALTRRLLERFAKNPITLTVNDKRANNKIDLRVGKIGLQTLIRGDLSNPRAFASLPALLYTIEKGDYSLLTIRMEQLYKGFGNSAMSFAVDCAAGWSPGRLARARREAGTALMSNINLQWQPEICKLTGAVDLGPKFRSPIHSPVSTLFINGTLDQNTPAADAETVRRGFPNSTHLMVENAGHETLPAAEVQDVILDFFKGQNVAKRTVSLPRPQFLSVDEAKATGPGHH